MNTKIFAGIITKILLCSASLGLFLYNVISSDYTKSFNIVTGVYVLFLSICLMYKSRHNLLVFMVFSFIAYCNYSILYGRYIYPEIAYINTVITSVYIDGIGINALLLFMTTILVFLKPIQPVKQEYGYLMNEKHSNNLVSWELFIVIILIGMLFLHPNADGGKAGYSPLYEYSTIFFIMGFYYTGRRKNFTSIALVVLLFFFVARDFFGGNRVTGLQLMLIFFIYFFSHRIKYWQLVLLGVIGIVLMESVAVYRSSYILGSNTLATGISGLFANKFAFDTAFYAYLASLTFIATRSFYTFTERMGDFMNFLASQVVIGTVGDSLYVISRKHFFHANGGILPAYMFYYLGWLGSIVSGLIVAIYMNLFKTLKESSNGLKKVIVVWIVATVPRWYVYSPYQLIKGVIFLTIVYYATYFIDQIIPKKQRDPDERKTIREFLKIKTKSEKV